MIDRMVKIQIMLNQRIVLAASDQSVKLSYGEEKFEFRSFNSNFQKLNLGAATKCPMTNYVKFV
jgi:hypothetical protein